MAFNFITAIAAAAGAAQAPDFGITAYTLGETAGDALGLVPGGNASNGWVNPANALVDSDTVSTNAVVANTTAPFYSTGFDAMGLVPAGAIVYGAEMAVRAMSNQNNSRLLNPRIIGANDAGVLGGSRPTYDFTSFNSSQFRTLQQGSLRTDEFTNGFGVHRSIIHAIDRFANNWPGQELQTRLASTSTAATLSLAWTKVRYRYVTPKPGNTLFRAEAFPSVGANINTGGTAWTNPGNAVSDNASSATCDIASGGTTQTLRCTGFGFSIPSNAVIFGIGAEVDYAAADQVDLRPSAYGFSNGGSTVNFGLINGDATFTDGYGQAATGGVISGKTMWGTMDPALVAGYTPAVVNGAGFGIDLKFNASPGFDPTTTDIDYVKAHIWYSMV